ncbi:MAG: tetratricopeptide repeat protein [Prevotella sp.]|nr:tetratricopeptide repeat protein [Prevotella sp.]
MAKKNQKATQTEAAKVANKSEEFFNKHKKLILGGLGAILLIIVAIIGYKQFIVKPRELKANNALAKGQNMFGNPTDSVSLKTFLSVADEYSSTDAGNLANLYSGLEYARQEKWDEAAKYLEAYKPGDDLMVSPMAIVALGDVYANQKKMDEAVSTFKRAADLANKANSEGKSNSVAPIALRKAGIILLEQGKKDEALAIFEDIKANYPQSPLYNEMDKFIEYASVK